MDSDPYVQSILERENRTGWVYVPPPDWKVSVRSLGKTGVKLFVLLVTIALGTVALIRHFRTAAVTPSKGRPEAHVWVDRELGLYYCSDNAVYRRLRPGEEMTQAAAKQKGFRPALGTCLVDSKRKDYTAETSAYTGPLTRPTEASLTVHEQRAEPSVKSAVEKLQDLQAHSDKHVDKTESLANTSTVMFISQPSGADIYVDGKFMGNTPSQIQLAAGNHAVRIEAKGLMPWSRAVALTTAGTITLQAILTAQ